MSLTPKRRTLGEKCTAVCGLGYVRWKTRQDIAAGTAIGGTDIGADTDIAGSGALAATGTIGAIGAVGAALDGEGARIVSHAPHFAAALGFWNLRATWLRSAVARKRLRGRGDQWEA